MSTTHMGSSSRAHAAQSLPNWWIREQVEAAGNGSCPLNMMAALRLSELGD